MGGRGKRSARTPVRTLPPGATPRYTFSRAFWLVSGPFLDDLLEQDGGRLVTRILRHQRSAERPIEDRPAERCRSLHGRIDGRRGGVEDRELALDLGDDPPLLSARGNRHFKRGEISMIDLRHIRAIGQRNQVNRLEPVSYTHL